MNNIKQKITVDASESVFKDKTLLLINTGSLKKRFIIQKLKRLGLKIIVMNPEKNWANAYVDRWIITDNKNHTKAIEDLENFLSAHPNTKIDGVLTFWEDDIMLTSKIADKFNLVGIPQKVAKKVRNKFLFRKFCEENSIKAPKHMLIKSAKDLEYAANNFSFPVVFKPTYGASSAFVVKANDKDEFYDTYGYIKNNISVNTESALNEGLEILVEDYIDGDEVDIDILLQNGKIKFYSIVDNYKTAEPFFIETQEAIPSNLPDKDQEDLIEMAEKVLEKLGIENGCVHFEAKATKNGPVPIEINLRMGGDETYSFTKEAWRVDLIEEAVKIAFGIYIEKIKRPETPRKYLISNTFTPENSGLLVKLNIKEEVKTMRGVEELCLFKKVGDPVLVPPEGYEYLGWIVVSGDNPIDAEDNLDEALKFIHYEVAKYDPASSIGKTLRKNRFSMASSNKDLLQGAAKIEHIRMLEIKDQRQLKIGIACNIFEGEASSVEADLMDVGKNIEKALVARGYHVRFFDFNNLENVISEIKKSDVDLIFNVCERINNSSLLEPHAAAILDTLQIPYTGSNPFTLGLCIDKIKVKKLMAYQGIPTPKWDYAYSVNDEIDESLQYPLIVKPANTDNSIGITNDSVVTDKKQLRKQLEKVITELQSPALVEEYIEGDEYDVSIIGSEEDDVRVLPLGRAIFSELPPGIWHIYPYEAKWADSSVYDKIITQRPPKNIPKRLEQLITEIALDTYLLLDCHDYGRVEVKVDKNGNPYVLELNPNPSINDGDLVPGVAELIGMDYGDFLEEIIRLAIKRYKDRPPYYHLQTNLTF